MEIAVNVDETAISIRLYVQLHIITAVLNDNADQPRLQQNLSCRLMLCNVYKSVLTYKGKCLYICLFVNEFVCDTDKLVTLRPTVYPTHVHILNQHNPGSASVHSLIRWH